MPILDALRAMPKLKTVDAKLWKTLKVALLFLQNETECTADVANQVTAKLRSAIASLVVRDAKDVHLIIIPSAMVVAKPVIPVMIVLPAPAENSIRTANVYQVAPRAITKPEQSA